METYRGDDGATQEQWTPEQQQILQPQVHGHRYAVTSSGYDPARTELIKQTYLLLAVAVFGAMCGGYFGMQSEAVLGFLLGNQLGWLTIFVLLNVVPWLALWVSNNNPRLAVPALFVDGVIGGIALAPLLAIAMYLSTGEAGPNIIHSAMVVTAAVFAGITFYVYSRKGPFNAGGGMLAAFGSLLFIACPLQVFFFQSPMFTTVLMAGIGMLGAWALVYNTNMILKDPDFNNPALGALTLWSALFHIFQAVLYFMMGSRD